MPGTPVRASRLRHDLLRYGAAIGAAVAFSSVQVFLIPRQLDVATYGQFRLFLLFVNYFGLLQVGITDGAFLRWAGRPIGDIAREWRQIIRWIAAIQFAILGLAAILTAFAAPVVRVYVLAIATCAMFVNGGLLSAYALQAAGDFRRAGRVASVAPALFVVAVLLLAPHTLTAILAAYAGAFLVSASYGTVCLARHAPTQSDDADRLAVRPLIRAGLPVMLASLAAGLSQSVDRLMVSAATPMDSFALYGFAGTASVAANSAVQILSRVALSHAAHKEPADRARFLGGFLHVIAAGFGIALLFEPLFEALVSRYLPLYLVAVPIVRAFTLGLPCWVALRVVVISTLQSHGHVKRLLAVELVGVAVVVVLCGALLLAHRPLWEVAAASSTSAVVTFAVGYFVARYVEETMRQQPVWRFLGVTGVQGIALLAALLLAQAWPARCGIYLLLSVVPTGWSLMLLRRQRW